MIEPAAVLMAQAIAQYFRRRQAGPLEWSVMRRQEIERYAEPIGVDTRLVDNSGSDVELGRSLTISNSAEHQFKVDLEASRRSGAAGKLGGTALGINAELSAHIERMVKAGISSSENRQHSVEEKLEFKSPPRTLLTITLAWKRIWQRGEVTLQSDQGQILVLAYEESVGLDFDISAVTSP